MSKLSTIKIQENSNKLPYRNFMEAKRVLFHTLLYDQPNLVNLTRKDKNHIEFFMAIKDSVYDSFSRHYQLYEFESYFMFKPALPSMMIYNMADTLFQDAVLSTYDRLRKIIGIQNPINGYSAMKLMTSCCTNLPDTNSDGKDNVTLPYLSHTICGFDKLQQKRYIKLKSADSSRNFIKIDEMLAECKINDDTASGKNSKYNYYINEHTGKVKEVYGFDASMLTWNNVSNPSGKPKIIFSCTDLPILLFIENHYNKLIKIKNKSSSQKWYETYRTCIHDINSYINNYIYKDKEIFKYGVKSYYFTDTDKNYLKYNLEKIFSFEAIDCLIAGIMSAKELGGDLSHFTHELAQCLKLPNAITRRNIIESAFFDLQRFLKGEIDYKSISSERISFPDYSASDNAKISAWLISLDHTITYLTEYAFPVYEALFFSSLYSSVAYSKKLDEEDQFADIIIEMYLTLTKYIKHSNIWSPDYIKRAHELANPHETNNLSPHDANDSTFFKDYHRLFMEFITIQKDRFLKKGKRDFMQYFGNDFISKEFLFPQNEDSRNHMIYSISNIYRSSYYTNDKKTASKMADFTDRLASSDSIE